MLDGQEERRTYSIVSPTGRGVDHDRRARAERRPHVRGTSRGDAQAGDTVEVLPPNGSFHARADGRGGATRTTSPSPPAAASRPSLDRRDRARSASRQSRFQLFYGNTGSARGRCSSRRCWRSRTAISTRFSVHFVMSREPQDVDGSTAGSTRRRSASSRAHDLPCPRIDEFFVCGPGTMSEDIPRRARRARCERAHPRRALRAGRRGRRPRCPRRRRCVAPPAPTPARRTARSHRRDGRPAAAFRCRARAKRPRRRGAGRPRPAVLLPRRRLLDLPREARAAARSRWSTTSRSRTGKWRPAISSAARRGRRARSSRSATTNDGSHDR